jgi:hypothetical protein
MRASSQQAFAFTNELKTNLKTLKPDLKNLGFEGMDPRIPDEAEAADVKEKQYSPYARAMLERHNFVTEKQERKRRESQEHKL